MPAHRAPDLVLYDDTCGMCRGYAARLRAVDPAGARWRPVGRSSAEARAALGTVDPASLPDSVVVVTPEGTLLVRSAAVARILSRRGGLHAVAGLLLRAIPRRAADAVYDSVARRRARDGGACPVP